MGEETAAVREVHERPGAVTHRAAVGEGAGRYTLSGVGLSAQRCARRRKLTAWFLFEKDRHFNRRVVNVIKQRGFTLSSVHF